jgi:hypothetical protein
VVLAQEEKKYRQQSATIFDWRTVTSKALVCRKNATEIMWTRNPTEEMIRVVDLLGLPLRVGDDGDWVVLGGIDLGL